MASPRVLIVEDDPMIRSVILRTLQKEAYRLGEAASAEEALALMDRGEKFDLILCDVVLPGLSGISAIPQFDRRGPCPVILMSGNADSEAEKDAKLLGAEALLPKPLDFSRLKTLIKQLTGG